MKLYSNYEFQPIDGLVKNLKIEMFDDDPTANVPLGKHIKKEGMKSLNYFVQIMGNIKVSSQLRFMRIHCLLEMKHFYPVLCIVQHASLMKTFQQIQQKC